MHHTTTPRTMSTSIGQTTTLKALSDPSVVSKDSHSDRGSFSDAVGRKRCLEGVVLDSRPSKKMKQKVEQFVKKELSDDVSSDDGSSDDISPKSICRVGKIIAQIEKMEKQRRRENRAFRSLLRKFTETYTKVAVFQEEIMSKRHDEKDVNSQQENERMQTFNSIVEELGAFIGTSDDPKFKWREQARGPTGTRSAFVDMKGDEWSNEAIWILYTPPKSRNIQTKGRTLNEDQGPFLSWGLPAKERFNRKLFRQGRPVFVIEKYSGSGHVQHRIKGMYICLKHARKSDDKLFLVTWEHFVQQVVFKRVRLEPPLWCQRPKN